MEHDERYQVRNLEIERALRTLAALIDGEVPEGWGWGLFLVPFGNNEAAVDGPRIAGAGKTTLAKAKGAVFWISNSERAGMIEVVKGWIQDNEKRTARGT